MPARYPSLFQINTRVRLTELTKEMGRRATLDDVPDGDLDALAADGFDLVYLLGVWQTGEAGRRISRTKPDLVDEYRRTLPDYSESDVAGSCFAVKEYRVHEDFGGDEALARMRERLRRRGLKLILDFVPNHVAPDHAWVSAHPEYFVAGTEEKLAAAPQNWTRTPRGILAYGRDPYFDGWSDTFQLNYGNPALQDAMLGELSRIARQCDGLRCDMAMLVQPEVFERTWGIRPATFWPRATEMIRQKVPGFLFLAEVYWDLEWTLQQQGFDFTYDKTLYDRLERGEAHPVHAHFHSGLDYQDHLARFLENHDEPRAAAVFPPEMHRAAAILTFFSPGLRFFHQGQREGKRVKIPVHLSRGPSEPVDEAIRVFYARLLGCLKDRAFHEGRWQLLECRAAWDGNPTADDFIAFAWTSSGGRRHLVAVNYSGHRGQCFVSLPWNDLSGRPWRLTDRMSPHVYDRPGDDLAARGLYLDVPEWGFHLFEVEPLREDERGGG